MAQGLSIHIGLNNVDPSRYNGWNGQLAGCVNDATDMQRIAQSLGYRSTLYTNSQATCATVLGAIGRAAQQLQSGDILFLSYSGHGGQVADVNGDEADSQDETWVLYDRMLVDDELGRCWSSFRDGVRVFVLSDSCHSGTVLRMMLAQQSADAEMNQDGGGTGATDADPYAQPTAGRIGAPPMRGIIGGVKAMPRLRSVQELMADTSQPRVKAIDPNVERVIRARDADLYATVQWLSNDARDARDVIRASVVLISGCQDNQVSLDGARNGLFTEKLLKVWNSGGFRGTYRSFHQAILDLMPSTQAPNLDTAGAGLDAFLAQRPFSIATATTTGTTAAPVPTIQGPASATRGGAPPVFQVNPGAGRYYAVEVATQADLFNSRLSGSNRNADNFFATWSSPPLISAASYPSTYALPDDAWQRLGASASRLYYRVWGSSAASAWTNYATSTPDGDAVRAPSLEVIAATSDVDVPDEEPAAGPTIVGPSSIPAGAASIRFQVNPGPGRYYAVEVATRAELLNVDNRSQRNSSNFYGSWSVLPYSRAAIYPSSYDLPAAVWQRLRQSGSALFYRIWATDSANTWVNPETSTADSDASSAPSVGITRDVGEDGGAVAETSQMATAGA